jgi:SAM-dependent methyltransferase
MALLFEAKQDRCLVCDGSKLIDGSRFELEDATLRWSRCASCGLRFQNPRISEESIPKLYSRFDYFGVHGGSEKAGYDQFTRHDSIRIAQSRRRIARIMKLTSVAGGRLLDVGSASGFFGVATREVGFDVTCVEPDKEVAAFGREKYGLTFLDRPLEHCLLQAASFDVVTVWGTDGVLLHPLHSFQQLSAALKPGGVLALTYQDFDHPIRHLFPSIGIGWNVIYNMTDRAFDIRLRKLGMNLVAREIEWQTVTMDHVFRGALRRPAPALLRNLLVRAPIPSVRFAVARKATMQGIPS